MAMPAPSSILLMDPYRTALITMALEERLLTLPPMSAEQLATQKATFKMGEDKEIRATVLQQLLLFDDPLIIQNEERDTAEKHAAEGIIDLSLRNLHEENIVQFATGKIDIPDWGGEFAKCWSDIEDQLRVLRSWMVDQLMSRFYIGHPSVYDCWFEAQRRACVSARGEPVDDTPLHAALAAVPLEWRDQTREILENPNRVGAVLFLVLNRLGEAWQIGKIAEERQVYAAIPHLDVPHASGGTEIRAFSSRSSSVSCWRTTSNFDCRRSCAKRVTCVGILPSCHSEGASCPGLNPSRLAMLRLRADWRRKYILPRRLISSLR